VVVSCRRSVDILTELLGSQRFLMHMIVSDNGHQVPAYQHLDKLPKNGVLKLQRLLSNLVNLRQSFCARV
jgi:hypothetical protein